MDNPLGNYRYILDRWTGEVVHEPDLLKWAAWLERHFPCSVAYTVLPNGIHVSTIFLALDHGLSFMPEPPQLFETMVFLGKPGRRSSRVLDGPWRYPDWPLAAAGHQLAVKMFEGRGPNE